MYLEFICPPVPFLITAGTSVFRPGDIHERRILKDTFDLIIVASGTLFIQEDETKFYLSEGDYLILRPGVLHKGFIPCKKEVKFNWIHFTTSSEYYFQSTIKHQKPRRMSHKQYYKRNATSIFIKQSGHIDTDTHNQLIRTLSLLNEVEINNNFRQKKFISPTLDVIESQQLFLNVLTELKNSYTHDSSMDLAAQIYSYIANNAKNHFSLDEIAKKFSFHKAYIIKLIKNAYEVTPAQLHVNFRLEDAKALLENTNMNIQEISSLLGYNDSAYFSKQFKQNIGISPTEYRTSKQSKS